MKFTPRSKSIYTQSPRPVNKIIANMNVYSNKGLLIFSPDKLCRQNWQFFQLHLFANYLEQTNQPKKFFKKTFLVYNETGFIIKRLNKTNYDHPLHFYWSVEITYKLRLFCEGRQFSVPMEITQNRESFKRQHSCMHATNMLLCIAGMKTLPYIYIYLYSVDHFRYGT